MEGDTALAVEPREDVGLAPAQQDTHLELRRKRQVKEMRMRMMVR